MKFRVTRTKVTATTIHHPKHEEFMKVNLIGMLKQIREVLPKRATVSNQTGLYRNSIDELVRHLEQVKSGKASLHELAEHYCFLHACRVCGCTEDDCSECIERTGQPCHWAEPDLCSACVPQSGARP